MKIRNKKIAILGNLEIVATENRKVWKLKIIGTEHI